MTYCCIRVLRCSWACAGESRTWHVSTSEEGEAEGAVREGADPPARERLAC